MRCLLTSLFFILLFSGCAAKPDPFHLAGKKHGVNPKTLKAISVVESGGQDNILYVNSWLFKGPHKFDNWFTTNLYMDLVLDPFFQNYDIGMCQINSQWIDKFDLDNEDLLDRYINVDAAARIYKYNVRVCKGEIYCALSMYNTGYKHSTIGLKYAKKVLRARKKLFGR